MQSDEERPPTSPRRSDNGRLEPASPRPAEETEDNQQQWEEDEADGREETPKRRRSDDDRRGDSGRDRDPGPDGVPENPTSLLVRRLKFNTTASTVKRHFEQCGPVKDVYLPTEYDTGRPRGFGFVEFVNPEDAQTALQTLHDTDLDGATISISVAQHGRKTPSVMRSRSGGYRRRGAGGSRFQSSGPYSAPDRYERGSPRRHYDDRRDYRGDYRDSRASDRYRESRGYGGGRHEGGGYSYSSRGGGGDYSKEYRDGRDSGNYRDSYRRDDYDRPSRRHYEESESRR